MTNKDFGKRISKDGKESTEVNYARNYFNEVQNFNSKNGVGKLLAFNVKTDQSFVLTINSNGQLAYIVPPNSTRIIEDGNWDFVLTVETLNLINDFKSQQETEKNNLVESTNGSRRAYNYTIDQLIGGALSKPAEIKVEQIVERKVVIDKHKTEFHLDINHFAHLSMDGVAQLYIETIHESLLKAKLELEKKNVTARTITTRGEIVNVRPVMRALNAALNDRDIQFQYDKRGQDTFTRSIVITVNLD